MLYVGYYEALEDGDIETIVFIKKQPTFQMKFYNIHANDGEIRKVERLTPEERGGSLITAGIAWESIQT